MYVHCRLAFPPRIHRNVCKLHVMHVATCAYILRSRWQIREFVIEQINIHVVLSFNLHPTPIQWNLWNKDTAGPCKSVLISEVSLIRRFPGIVHYSIGSNSGPRTLVRIVEVSIIGGVRFRRFHCITNTPSLTIYTQFQTWLHLQRPLSSECINVGLKHSMLL